MPDDDIIDCLLEDHQGIRELFRRMQTAPSDQARLELARTTVRTLSQHDAAEEMVVWPAARAAGLGDLVDRRLDEERELREEVHQLDRSHPAAFGFDSHVARVQSIVQEHVTQEERGSFPRLREALDANTRRRLAADYRAARDAAPTRPHPLAPSQPPGLTIAGAIAAPVDRLRDRLRAARESRQAATGR